MDFDLPVNIKEIEMAIQTIMVIGAGQLGGGIAQVFAQAGKKVFLNDIKQEFIDGRMAFVEKLLDKDISKGKKTEEEKAVIMSNLHATLDPNDAAECDLVVEAAIENIEAVNALSKK